MQDAQRCKHAKTTVSTKVESPESQISRRAALANTLQGAALLAAASSLKPLGAGEPPERRPEPRIWDAHCHLNASEGTPRDRMAKLLSVADRMGIERLIVFMGYPMLQDPSPDEVRQQNDQVIEAVEHSHGRAFGFVYLNPKHTEASLEELDRCVRDGPLIGIKLWVAVHCDQPCLDPIVAHAEKLKAPILQHTWIKVTGNLPGESIPSDLAKLAGRHPNASFIAAHVGGDWERGIRAIRPAKNVVAEVCGSDPTAGMVEMAVRELGAERVMFGSDAAGRSFSSQLAKVLGADISDDAKHLILRENLRRMLKPILAAKEIPL
jgi:predicted TIM-barrel fold metal-dependent hydrolase